MISHYTTECSDHDFYRCYIDYIPTLIHSTVSVTVIANDKSSLADMIVLYAGASIRIYRWRQMCHGVFFFGGGNEQKV